MSKDKHINRVIHVDFDNSEVEYIETYTYKRIPFERNNMEIGYNSEYDVQDLNNTIFELLKQRTA